MSECGKQDNLFPLWNSFCIVKTQFIHKKKKKVYLKGFENSHGRGKQFKIIKMH